MVWIIFSTIIVAIAIIYYVNLSASANPVTGEPSKRKKKLDRAKASQWAKSLLNSEDWIIIDTETTGLNENAQVIEIGIINHKGEILLSQRIKPIGISTMPSAAKKVHGIGIPDLKQCPTLEETAPQLLKIIKSKRVIAFNASYDYRLLTQSATANDIAIGLPSFECAMLKYSMFIGEWNDYRKSYKWQKLPMATHGAIGDCMATFQALKEMAQK